MKQYIDILKDIKENGITKPSRAGDTKSLFVRVLRHDMDEGFPLLTIKNTSFHNIVHELLWFLGAFDEQWKKFGNTNIRYLVDHGVHIWDKDAYRGYREVLNEYTSLTGEPYSDWMVDDPVKNELRPATLDEFIFLIKNNDNFALKFGELGDTYGASWRRWSNTFIDGEDSYGYEQIDQIKQVIDNLKSNPLSRRHIVTAWNPSVVDDLTLPPCHYAFTLNARPLENRERNDEFFLRIYKKGLEVEEFGRKDLFPVDRFEELYDKYDIPKYKLSLNWKQRSVDTPLGLPYNVASYALLLKIIAYLTNMVPDEVIGSLEDTHYYMNQEQGVNEMIRRYDNGEVPSLPYVRLINLDNVNSIDDFRVDNFELINYNPMDKINIKLSVGLEDE